MIKIKTTQAEVTKIFCCHSSSFVAAIVYDISPVQIPAKSIPVCTNAVTDPRGIARPVIAVARPLSLSPNHRLQIIFCAERKIGLAKEIMKDPSSIDQKCPSKVLIYLIQQPTIKSEAPIRKVNAADIAVYILIEIKNIGIAVMPKQRVHKLTCIKGTE